VRALALLWWASWLPAAVFNVRDFGAAADGKSNDAAAIQRAIEAAARGGGVVYFPAGDYLSGTIVLRSNVTLHLAPGATLWGSRRMADYNPPHLIYAREAQNIAIEGGGTIDGNGDAFWEADFTPKRPRPSPLIELWGCRNVRLRDLTIRNAPAWTIHPKNCDGVWIRGLSIINHMNGLNTDGIDPDSSRNVVISDCHIEAGDDCIVLKTTQRGEEPVRPCENVTVSNCTLVSSASALKLGTESHADFRHCVFSNCVIRNSRTGIALLAKDGGTMEGVRFHNITIESWPKFGRGVEWPVTIDLERRGPESRLSRVRDVSFSDIRIYTRGRVLVGGLAERPVEDVSFSNVVMRVLGFEAIERAGKLRGGTAQPVPREQDFGNRPAAFIFANARGVQLQDVAVIWEAAGAAAERHAIYAHNVEDLRVEGFTGRQAVPQGSLGVIALEDCRNVRVSGSRAAAGAGVFLQLRNTPAGEVSLEGNDLRKAWPPGGLR